MQDSQPSLKHCIICTFLVHSDSVQKMLTTLFKLVWNTQKNTLAFFFKYQAGPDTGCFSRW